MESAYARAGVDIRAGERAVDLMKAHVSSTSRPEVIGGLGGFAGFFDVSSFKGYRHPVLATSTDGVGTKVAIAAEMGVHGTIGFDLVGMLVDDLVVVGAEPLFVTDYISCGKVVPETIAAIVKGISAACVEAGAALLGGETAEHPGLLGEKEFDLAGATTGVVEYDEILGAKRVREGDRVICLKSSGLHSNGYSLVRHVFSGMSLDAYVDEFGRTLGEELLTPTRVYAQDCLEVVRKGEVHAMSHITGGGLANNLARVMPDNLAACVNRATWSPGPIFTMVQKVGRVSQADIEETLNMGVGMVMICPESFSVQTIDILGSRGVAAWDAGVVEKRESGNPAVRLVGHHS